MCISFRPFSASVWVAVLTASLAYVAPVRADDCPGHPDALGTSRTLVVDPAEHPLIGTMQYRETLPLEDHEVVLTFDDGPLPKHSKPVLDILAAQCVKATFFIVGKMATEFPETLREAYAAGHTIGTHTQNHPLGMNKMPIDRDKAEIDVGIASTQTALGDSSKVAPFVRIPGLLRSTDVEDYLVSRGLMAWSADFPADDWHRISPARVTQLALARLEAKGRGVLLLHDIQARTQNALPTILRELKARGYRIVHVVPATAELPKTPTQPWQWHLHPVNPDVASAAGLQFTFTPRTSYSQSKQTAMAAIPALPQKTANKGNIGGLWMSAVAPQTDDALSLLLSPSPERFEFSFANTHEAGLKSETTQ